MPRWNTYPENLSPALTDHVVLVDTDERTTVQAIVDLATASPLPTGGTTGQVLAKQSATNYDVDWDDPATTVTVTHYETLTFPTTVAESDTASAWRAPGTGVLVSAIIWCDTAPTTDTIIVDLLKNGTTVFTGGTERPVIATSSTDDVSGTPSITAMAAGDLFQFTITQLNAADEGNIGQLLCQIVWTG